MSKRLKAAVIGTGFIGGAHVEALKRVPGVDVVATCDAQIKADNLDVPEAFLDYRVMIDTIKPDCVHMCTPNNTHKDICHIRHWARCECHL